MKHTWKAAAAGALAVLFVSPQANAQLAVAKVVATCGTVSPTPHAGANYPLTIDITGTLCSVGGGGGGGGTSSNFGATFPGAGTAAGFEYLTVPPTLTTGQMVAGQTDVNGNLKVTVVAGGGSNASVGTTAAAVPGSATYAGMNVSGNLTGLTGTANGLKVDGSAVTQPVSGTVGLAAGAAAIGTVNPTTATLWGILTQGSTTSGEVAQLMMGAATTSAPTYITGDSYPVSLDTAGNLRVLCSNCSGSGVSAADNATFTAGTTVQAAAGAVATASPTSGAVTTGHQGAVGMSLNREQWIDAGASSNLITTLNAGYDATLQANRVTSTSNSTPIDCSGTATGSASSVANLGTTSIHGFTIQNESTTVNLSYSLTGTAVAGAVGTFTLLPLGQSPNSYTTPVGFGSNHAVSVISSASDIYTCTAF